MPQLLKFLLLNTAIGFTAAFAFVAGLIALDINGLRTLILNSDMGGVAFGLLSFFTGLTFASVQMGIAVMRLSRADGNSDAKRDRDGDDDRFPPTGPGGGQRGRVPVKVRASRR